MNRKFNLMTNDSWMINGSGTKLKEILVAVLVGGFLGLFVKIFTGLNIRWIVSFTFALTVVFIGMSVKWRKQFFLSLFILSTIIITENYIGKLQRLHQEGPANFYNAPYDLVLAILYLLWIPGIFVSKISKIHFSRLDFCIAALVGISFLSMLNAVDFYLCLYEIARLIVLYAVFFYMANAVERADLKFVIVSILAGLFLESILGISQFYGGNMLNLGLMGQPKRVFCESFWRVGGTMGHPNIFANYFNFVLPLSICLIFSPIKKIYKVICALISLLGITTLLMTLSRGGWLAFIISLMAVCAFSIKAKLISLRRLVFIAVLAFMILISVICVFHKMLFTRLFSDDEGSALSRVYLAEVAVDVIKAHPFLGVGINNYTEVMDRYDNCVKGISFKEHCGVHNAYLLIAAEIGIPALLVLLYIAVIIYKKGFDVLYCGNNYLKCITIGLLAGITGGLIHFFSEPLYLVHHLFLLFWIFSGLIVALNRISKINTC